MLSYDDNTTWIAWNTFKEYVNEGWKKCKKKSVKKSMLTDNANKMQNVGEKDT